MPKSLSNRHDLALLNAFWNEPVTRTVLPNGAVLIQKRDTSAALASVQVWVKTGSVHEGAQLGAGLSHYLEHLLFKGTERRAGREISGLVQAHGGYINAYTTYDRTVYYVDLPSEHVGVAIDLLADVVLHSTLPADEVTREKDVILREIAMTRDDPENRLWDALFATAFRVHPCRHPVIGHREVFAAVSREELLAYYRERYVPNNLVVVAVGDIDPAAVQASVEEHFGRVPRARLASEVLPSEPAQLAPRLEHRTEDVELTRGVMAWPIPGMSDDDAPALDLLATVLGHGDSSVLWREVRERLGLVHQIDSAAWNPGATGLFCVSFTCEPAKRSAAERGIARVLARWMRRPPPASDLRKALRQLVVGEINTRKTMSGQASRLGVAEVVVGDLGHSRTYFEQLGRLTPRELQRVARRYLVDSRLTLVTSSPPAPTGTAVLPAVQAEVRPEFSEVRLANGARLLLQPDPRLPNLHLRLLMQGGPLFEAPERRGTTALLATMLTKDTRRRSAGEVARYIESVGGAFFPFSGNNSVGLGIEVLPTDAFRAVEVLADAMLRPAFLPATLAVERDAQLAALQQDEDDVVTWARKRLRERFFGSYPLAFDAVGSAAGVRALTPADLMALHARLGVAANVVLAVAGDFDPDRLAPRLEALLAPLPSGPAPVWSATVPVNELPVDRGNFVEHRPREQAVVLRAYPGPAVNDEDFYVGEVMDELFSGMASRLFERVREEKGLAYFVRSSRVTGIETGMFSFLAGTQPGREEEVLAEIDAEIARVQQGEVAAAELARCQARLKAARRQGMQTNSARALQAGLNALQGQPINDWQNYDVRIEGVAIGHLAEFARRRFVCDRCTQLVVRP